MENIFWSGYSHKDRIAAVSEIEMVINQYGNITDFKQFSDVSIALQVEIRESRLNDLYHALEKTMGMNEHKDLAVATEVERVLFLHVSFSTGKGELRIEVPLVPG